MLFLIVSGVLLAGVVVLLLVAVLQWEQIKQRDRDIKRLQTAFMSVTGKLRKLREAMDSVL